jgi:hypothetical protein
LRIFECQLAIATRKQKETNISSWTSGRNTTVKNGIHNIIGKQEETATLQELPSKKKKAQP